MELAFQLHHGAAHGGLGESQRLTGLAKAAALGNAEKDLELAEADVHGWREKNQIYDFKSLINLIN
jgi:hypothetical protein